MSEGHFPGHAGHPHATWSGLADYADRLQAKVWQLTRERDEALALQRETAAQARDHVLALKARVAQWEDVACHACEREMRWRDEA